MSDKYDHISEEMLGAFIEGNTSFDETEAILDAIRMKEDLETLALGIAASSAFVEDSLDDMPNFDDSEKIIEIRSFGSLPMAGFLGNATKISDADSSDNEEER